MAKTRKSAAKTSNTVSADTVYGSVHLTDYKIVLNVIPNRLPTGTHVPDVFAKIIFTGTNQSGQSFKNVEVRFREIKSIVTNPTAATDDTLLVEMPASNYGIIQDLIARTIDAAPSKGKIAPMLLLRYQSTSNVNEYTATFSIG